MSDRKKVFLTFGGGTPGYHHRVETLCKQAEELDFFTDIHGYTDVHLQQDDRFWNKHATFVQQCPRGYGYWIWKPYLILKELEKMNDGDVVMYIDAGCEINPTGKPRLYEYMDLLDKDPNQYGVISFELTHLEHKFTKNAVFSHFQVSDTVKNTNIHMATVIILKKTDHSMKLIQEWYDTACRYDLLNDHISDGEQPEFIGHRHDQSIFSVLRKIRGSVVIPDETYFNDWSEGTSFPFLAKRVKN
jgi:hypothetical protein